MNLNKNWTQLRKYEDEPEAASSTGPEAEPASEGESGSEGDSSGDSSYQETPAPETDDDYVSSMTDDYLGEGGDEPEPAPAQEAAEPESPPAEPAEPQQVAPPPSPSKQPESGEPSATPQTPQEVEAPVAPTPPTPSAPTPPPTAEETQRQLREYREKIIPDLQAHYKLSDEDAAELESNPAEVLPKIMANMHYDLTHAVYSGVMSQIPQMIQQTSRQAARESELEGKFFGKYPGLRGHEDIVSSALQAALQSNLASSYEEVEQLAATMAAIRLKVPIEQLQGNAGAVAPSGGATSPTPLRQVPAGPIAPGGTAAPIAPQPRQGGMADTWADMVEFEVRERSG